MPVYISFFRGINVGGRHLVKIKDLCALHESLGFENVATILQSGNVVFRAGDAKSIASRIEDAFEKQFGFRSAVIVRSGKELRAAAERCPFQPDGSRNPSWIAVAFFASKPDERVVERLQSYEGPEDVQISGREIYVYYAAGMGRSKLPMTGPGTVRNWNTIQRLLAKAAKLGG